MDLAVTFCPLQILFDHTLQIEHPLSVKSHGNTLSWSKAVMLERTGTKPQLTLFNTIYSIKLKENNKWVFKFADTMCPYVISRLCTDIM